MDEGEGQSDGDGGESGRGLLVCRAHDHQQEHARHHNFADQSGQNAVFFWRGAAHAIGGKIADGVEAGFAGGDEVDDPACHQSAQHLGNDVGDQVAGRKAFTSPKPQRDRGIEVRSGDVPDGIGHGEHGESESERDTRSADPLAGQDGGTAAAHYEPESSEEFRAHAFYDTWHDYSFFGVESVGAGC